MLRYPKIATLKFVNKQVNCKLILRAKMFDMDLYYHDTNKEHMYVAKGEDGTNYKLHCPIQHRGRTLSELRMILYDVTKRYTESVLKKHFSECPICGSKIFQSTKRQIKIYATCNNRALDAGYILNLTQFRFNKRPGMFGSHSYVAFVDDYKTLVSDVSADLIIKDKKVKCELVKMNPFPTEQQLVDCLEEYKSWKVAKEL